MIRWSEDQLREYHSLRRGRSGSSQDPVQSNTAATRAKYRNKKTQIDGRTFDSKLEATRYVQLKRAQEAGMIFGLQCQVPFSLEVGGILVCKYIADFVYVDIEGNRIVEDAKGVRTREYQIKRKLMMAVHRIDIKEFRREKNRKNFRLGDRIFLARSKCSRTPRASRPVCIVK